MITLYNCSVISYGMVSLSGAELGTFILQVTANDVDLNPILEYTFAPNGNPEGTFDIELYSGRITLAKPLDYEHKPRYTLLVQVCMIEEAYLITRRQHMFTLDMKGCICHFTKGRSMITLGMKGCISHSVKWEIHPFISKWPIYYIFICRVLLRFSIH